MKNISIYICSILLLSLAACEKYIEIPAPQNELVSENVFTNDKTATASVVGIYSRMNQMNNMMNVLVCLTGGYASDELEYRYNSTDHAQFRNNELLPSNSLLSNLWAYPYAYIYQANSCIEGLTASTSVSEAVKNQLMGEVKVVRAFCYFYLINMFGDVPLLTTTDFNTNNVAPRTPVEQVYATIIEDLKEAQTLLVDEYPSTERIRPNNAVATALLARAYLYTKQWDKAETEASKVIANTAMYDLIDLDDVFLKNSKETLWQLQTVNPSGWNSWEGNNFNSLWCKMQDGFADAFEPGDSRKTHWLKQPASLDYYYPYKYKKARTIGQEPVEYGMVLRLAELYLIRAEARAQQNTAVSLAGAKDDIDKIRDRADLGVYTGLVEKEALLSTIEHERRIELFSEWGHRWFDLKRTDRATAVLSPVKPDWQPKDMLFPLPLTAMRSNPNLTQNDY